MQNIFMLKKLGDISHLRRLLPLQVYNVHPAVALLPRGQRWHRVHKEVGKIVQQHQVVREGL